MLDLGGNPVLSGSTRALENRVSIQSDHHEIGLKCVRCSSIEKHKQSIVCIWEESAISYTKCGKTRPYPFSKERKKPNQGSDWLYKWEWCVLKTGEGIWHPSAGILRNW